jgi:hypothetical protein
MKNTADRKDKSKVNMKNDDDRTTSKSKAKKTPNSS